MNKAIPVVAIVIASLLFVAGVKALTSPIQPSATVRESSSTLLQAPSGLQSEPSQLQPAINIQGQ